MLLLLLLRLFVLPFRFHAFGRLAHLLAAFLDAALRLVRAAPTHPLAALYERHAAGRYSLADRAFLARVHPLELWVAAYLRDHPHAPLAQVIDAFTVQLGVTRCSIYMQDYGGPVGFRLALAHPDSPAAQLVRRLHVGKVVGGHDPAEAGEALLDLMREPFVPATADDLSAFDRRALAERLSDLLRGVTK